MNILLISQYFWPESFIINDLVQCLSAQGHTIEVLTGKPNYPDGDIFKGYTAKGCDKEQFNEVIRVHRVPIFPRGPGGGLRLTLNYLSFVLNGLFYFHRAIKSTPFDVILVYAPSPITSVIPASYLKKKLKIPLAVWVQDLWPESLLATGFVTNRILLSAIGKLVRWIYASADTLLVQSEAFKRPMMQYVAEEKIIYYPNSYLDVPSGQVDKEFIPDELLLELERHQCFVFAGNIGTAQSVVTLVEAADRLRHLSDCKIILVGSGSMSGWAEQQILLKGLNNLMLAGRFPSACMPGIFSRAVGLLVTLKRNDIFTYTIPSKIQSYLAAGRPIIAALDGEGARIIRSAGAGLIGPAEDAVALADNIEQLYRMKNVDRDKLGLSGRAYFLRNFEMQSQSRRLVEILEKRRGI